MQSCKLRAACLHEDMPCRRWGAGGVEGECGGLHANTTLLILLTGLRCKDGACAHSCRLAWGHAVRAVGCRLGRGGVVEASMGGLTGGGRACLRDAATFQPASGAPGSAPKVLTGPWAGCHRKSSPPSPALAS